MTITKFMSALDELPSRVLCYILRNSLVSEVGNDAVNNKMTATKGVSCLVIIIQYWKDDTIGSDRGGPFAYNILQ